MKALDGQILDGAVHPLDFVIVQGIDIGEPVLDAVLAATHIKRMSHLLRGLPI